jgi:exodeoxyribonuclease-5
VVTATFTGKAALMLRRKGTPARTIHSLIYSVIEATEDEVEAAEKKIEEAIAGVKLLSGFERTMAESTIQSIRHGVAEMKHPRFALNPKSDTALPSSLFLMGTSRGKPFWEPEKTGAAGFH